MVKYCNLCRAKRDTSGNIFLHKYPLENTERSMKWRMVITQAYRSNPLFKYEIKNHTKICSRHFRTSDFHLVGEGRIQLEPNAVPTLFPDVHKYIPPREYYNPICDHSDDGIVQQKWQHRRIQLEQNAPRTVKPPITKFFSNHSIRASESLLISNQKRNLATTNEQHSLSVVGDFEMPAIGIIVRAHDTQVVELNTSKTKCQLCFNLCTVKQTANLHALESSRQADLMQLLQIYFNLNSVKILCLNCLEKCDEIVNLKRLRNT